MQRSAAKEGSPHPRASRRRGGLHVVVESEAWRCCQDRKGESFDGLLEASAAEEWWMGLRMSIPQKGVRFVPLIHVFSDKVSSYPQTIFVAINI